jgi:hypothetical protein
MCKKLLLLLTLATALNSVEAHSIQCAGFLKTTVLSSSSLLIYKSPKEFLVEDSQSKFGEFDEPFHFNAFLENGEISITAILRYESLRSNNLSGSKLFDEMIEHFSPTRIKKIHGSWFNYSDNYAVFYQALNMGLNPSEAAMLTWTGQQALKHGFLYASVSVLKDSSGIEAYDSLQVVFSKIPNERSDLLKTIFPKDWTSLRDSP